VAWGIQSARGDQAAAWIRWRGTVDPAPERGDNAGTTRGLAWVKTVGSTSNTRGGVGV